MTSIGSTTGPIGEEAHPRSLPLQWKRGHAISKTWIRYDLTMSDDVRNVLAALSTISEHWQPHRLTTVNDYDVKVVKIQGEFVWHTHPDTDEPLSARLV